MKRSCMNANNIRGPAYYSTLALCMNLLALFNYVLWCVGISFPTALLLVPVVALIIGCCLNLKFDWPILLFLLFILLGAIGTPIVDWDARSIWFFHAKRIYIDGSIYAQLDNYADWSHNDYPNIFPSLAASIAHSFGRWNEVLPKLSVVLLISPCLLVFKDKIKNTNLLAMFLILLAWMCREILINGYADGLLGLLTLASILIITDLTKDNRLFESPHFTAINLALLSSLLTIICLLKNEGLLIFLILTFIFIAIRRNKVSTYIACTIPLVVYLFSWKIYLLKFGVHNDLMVPGLFSRILGRLNNHSELSLILVKILSKSGLYFALIFGAIFTSRRNWKHCLPGAAFIAAYSAALFSIYLSTPADLAWHIATSLSRTFLTINITALGILFYCIDRRLSLPH